MRVLTISSRDKKTLGLKILKLTREPLPVVCQQIGYTPGQDHRNNAEANKKMNYRKTKKIVWKTWMV
jgi:hypothetical protein